MVVLEVRKYFSFFVKGIENAVKIRDKINRINNVIEFLEFFEEFAVIVEKKESFVDNIL